jgi:PIN domain nuclease of toxin-antitoxin system
MIVLDTHALLWWALDPEKLSSTALELVTEMEVKGGFASSISIWELAIKTKRGKLELPLTVEELARRIERGGVVDVLAVDTDTWLRSAALPWQHRDAADRVIVATAMRRGLPILTKDEQLHAYRDVRCIW